MPGHQRVHQWLHMVISWLYLHLIDLSWLPLIRGRLLKNGHRDLARFRGTLRVNTYRVICLELSNLLCLQSLVPKLGVTGTGETDMQHLENTITITSYERDGVWNRGQIVCLFNGLFRVTPKRHQSPSIVDSPHKRPVLWKAFPCHYVLWSTFERYHWYSWHPWNTSILLDHRRN